MKGGAIRTVVTREVQKIPINSIVQNSRSAYLFSDTNPLKEVFPYLQRIKKEEINSTLEKIINGQIIDWKTTPEISKVLGYPQGIFSRSLATMFENPDSKETDQGFEMLDNDLKRFSPNLDLLKSDNFEEWFYKSFILGIHFHANYSRYKKVGKEKIPQAEKYQNTIEKQLHAFEHVIENLQLTDLPLYFRYCDSQTFDYDNCKKSSKETWAANFLAVLLEKDEKTWDRLKIGWGWEQINQAISFLPKTTIQNVREHTRAATGENLALNTIRPTKDIYGRGNKDWPQAIKSFLLEVPKDNSIEWYEGDYPNLLKVWKQNLELPGFSVPRRYTPSTAIELLSRIGEVDEPDRFTTLLSNIHELVKDKEHHQTAWLTTLIAIKSKVPKVSGFIQETIKQWDSIPQIVRDTLSDKRPGHIWLTRAGKIRVTDEMNLSSAFPLYTSSCEKIEPEPIEIVDFSHSQEAIIEPSESVKIPLLGEIGTVNNQSSYLLERMFSGLPEKELNRILDEDRLLEENISHTKKWTKVLQPDKQHFLYHSKLNLNDPLIKRASNLGIEAIYIKGSEVLLVLNGKITGSESLNIAIQGKIKENGELSIKGTSETFIGDPENLFLANLVLHCVNKPKMGCLYADKQIKAGVNQMISSWNRTTRKELPEICYPASTQEASIIALTIPEVKQTIFVSHVNLTASQDDVL